MRSATKVAVALIVVAVLVGAGIAAYTLTRPAPGDSNIPKLEYYTTDLTGVALTSDDLNWIDEVCYEVDQNSSCEMAVVVVNNTLPYDINQFAQKTFQYNGIGKAGRDNGVLIVVATDDNEWRIEVGYGLEGILPDVRVAHLAQDYLVPNMTAGLYGDGLFELTAAMGQILEGEYTGDRSGEPAFPIDFIPLTWGQWAIVLVVVVVLSIVTRGRILYPILWILSLIGGGRGGFGGGRSGGGGASGR